MRQKHQQNLDDVDSMIDNVKQQLGSNILKMTMGELKKHKLYHDIEDTINANMNELNKTLIEKMQINDDGMNAINTKFMCFGSMVLIFIHLLPFSLTTHSSSFNNTHPSLSLSLSFLSRKILLPHTLKAISQVRQATRVKLALTRNKLTITCFNQLTSQKSRQFPHSNPSRIVVEVRARAMFQHTLHLDLAR